MEPKYNNLFESKNREIPSGPVLGASMGDPTHDKVMQDSRDSLGHPTHEKVMRKRPDKQGFRTRQIPWTCSSIYPKTRICLSTVLCLLPTLLTLTGAIPNHLSLEKINLGL